VQELRQEVSALKVKLSKVESEKQMLMDLQQWGSEGKEPRAKMLVDVVYFVTSQKQLTEH
jgi:hypothetical protein